MREGYLYDERGAVVACPTCHRLGGWTRYDAGAVTYVHRCGAIAPPALITATERVRLNDTPAQIGDEDWPAPAPAEGGG